MAQVAFKLIAQFKSIQGLRTAHGDQSAWRGSVPGLLLCAGMIAIVCACGPDAAVGEEPAKANRSERQFTSSERQFWSLQPVMRPNVPASEKDNWSRNDVDRFVLARLRPAGIEPAPEADKQTLARRAYFDLTGLPPTPAELDEFLADESSVAYENLIERLLASPRYGERWGRHWLDLVRYAESDGYRQDAYRPNAWRYRDYVIAALNADKPYDRFVSEQLAGDEIAPGDLEALVATGFLRQGVYEYNQRDVRVQWNEILNEVTDATGDVFLGLGVSCARCHDHKFDPILRSDYYKLQAFFAPMRLDDGPIAVAPDYADKLAAWQAANSKLLAQIAEIERPGRKRLYDDMLRKFPADIQALIVAPFATLAPLERQYVELASRQFELEEFVGNEIKDKAQKAEWEKLRKELAELAKSKPEPPPAALTVRDIGPLAPTTHIPGNEQGKPVEPEFFAVLDQPLPTIDPAAQSNSTGRRAALARWLTSPEHPLTWRVMVNRIWQHHFGRGLVTTTSDFGTLGARPSHPELLDWLAAEFVARSGSMKQMHRLIMNSATYRQASLRETPEAAQTVDPDNHLLWRHDVQRLEAEQIRDAALATAGELDLTLGGPSTDAASRRRSVYLKVVRNTRDLLLDAFDLPEGFTSSAERNVTTTPSQSLLLVNGKWALERATALARRLRVEQLYPARISLAYRIVFGREVTEDELVAALAFVNSQPPTAQANPSVLPGAVGSSPDTSDSDAVWIDFCHALLNSNEFLYVD